MVTCGDGCAVYDVEKEFIIVHTFMPISSDNKVIAIAKYAVIVCILMRVSLK